MKPKTILITGGSRGIGFEIAKKFASEGWQVGFGSKNKDSVALSLSNLQNEFPGAKIWAIPCDFSIKEDALSFAEQAIKEFGMIDMLVNNAGQYIPGNITDEGFEDGLESLINTNLLSAYWVGKIIIPNMKKHQKGIICNISSIAGLQAYPGGGSYAISKFALTGYTKTLRLELNPHNIKVMGVYPGATYTDSWSASDLPKSRFIPAEDIAKIIFLHTQLSESTVIEDIVIRPQLGDI
jgi:NAD(P)-dependent dehydrogenase (short-subunit alcohol dehydrogenase family)